MATRRLAPLAIFALGALSSCGDELDPAWKVKGLRILAAPIENLDRAETPAITDAAPGERVRLSVVLADDRDPPRDAQVAWVFCAEVGRTGNTFGCTQAGASVAMGREVEYRLPTGVNYTVDTQGRARVQVLAIVCAGTLALDPATRAPTCTGTGAVSWTMTRSILVRRPGDTDPSNHNPAIREVVLYRGANDVPALDPATPLRLPRCTSDPCTKYTIEVRPADGSRERYTTLNNQAQTVSITERLVFGYFTTLGTFDGTFRVDTDVAPMATIRNTLEAPRTAGTARLWFTAQDARGGVTVTERTIIFE